MRLWLSLNNLSLSAATSLRQMLWWEIYVLDHVETIQCLRCALECQHSIHSVLHVFVTLSVWGMFTLWCWQCWTQLNIQSVDWMYSAKHRVCDIRWHGETFGVLHIQHFRFDHSVTDLLITCHQVRRAHCYLDLLLWRKQTCALVASSIGTWYQRCLRKSYQAHLQAIKLQKGLHPHGNAGTNHKTTNASCNALPTCHRHCSHLLWLTW